MASITLTNLSSLSYFVLTTTKKRLLIPDQHVTRIPRSVRVWSQTICISRGSRIETFRVVINRFEQIHYPKKKGSRPNPQHDG
jgi:hypothetical protein